MKRNRYIIIILLGMMFFTACESFLEENVLDSMAVGYLYETADGLEVGVNALYNLQRSNNFPSGEGEGLMSNAFFYVGTDLGHNRTWHRPYGTNHTAAGYTSRKWVVSYQIIDRANALINNAPNIDMVESQKNKLVAQARILRAELYLDLIRMYDNILFDTIATTPENAFDSIDYNPADPVEVFKLIDGDLDFAIENLDWKMGYGRYGKAVAYHLKGKSLLWQASYLNMGTDKYAQAAESFDAVINDNTHKLVKDCSGVFGQELSHSEALFVYTRNEILGGSDDLAGGGGTWISSMFNNRVYELSSGEVIRSVEYGGQSLGWSFPNDYLMSLYDQENDKRFRTYYYPLELYVNNPSKKNYGEPLPVDSYDDDYRRHHWSLKKFHDEEKNTNNLNSYKDIMYYRYAETLLLSAEAHWHVSGDNHDATALKYINQIRNRAGVSDFTEFTLDTYLEESARELAFEKNRWFLLKRLGLLLERQNMYYTYGSNSTNTVLEPMAPYMIRMPIPQSQIDLMGTFPQNEGY